MIDERKARTPQQARIEDRWRSGRGTTTNASLKYHIPVRVMDWPEQDPCQSLVPTRAEVWRGRRMRKAGTVGTYTYTLTGAPPEHDSTRGWVVTAVGESGNVTTLPFALLEEVPEEPKRRLVIENVTQKEADQIRRVAREVAHCCDIKLSPHTPDDEC